ncbi:MAG TPA: 4-hydroxythreonine-4-phosphate dehydrogenase PdxA [Caulobacteraceae bacterium]|jgi:4-hydroxythreonine-4-phosphate dehydrogenase|nr:4-hydroxythreonine-4-phosphate dehydrogenase PdxA [Caulobacteraceae bacterium]
MTLETSLSGLPIAVTMGDPAGVGPEIVAQLAAERRGAVPPVVVIGDPGRLARAASLMGLPLAIREVASASDARGEGVFVLRAGEPLPGDLAWGRIDARAGAAAFAYVSRAIDLALAGEVRAIVTAPLSKEAMAAAGIGYPGHTEILADRAAVADYAMMLANDELRVVLVSIHLSLADAIAAVTPAAELRAIRLAHQAGRLYGLAHPRVAVAGLNPHAGEGGMFGREEIEIIAPAIAAARAEGIEVSGPFAGDTIFMRARRGEFDVVVAQYHDQGLIPVKYLGVERGVNVTLGLPFVRTSVDHGTAFDIAGTGAADASSLGYAFDEAVRMTRGQPGSGT